MVEHPEGPPRLGQRSLAGERKPHVALVEPVAGEELPPNLEQVFKLRGEARGRLDRVVRRHHEVIGADLPAVFDVGVPIAIHLERDPPLASGTLARFPSR